MLGEKSHLIYRWFEIADTKTSVYQLEANVPDHVVAGLESLIGQPRSRWTVNDMKAVAESLKAIEFSDRPEQLSGPTVTRIRTRLKTL